MIFGVDDQVLSRGLQKVSGGCLQKIKPLFGSCIEKAVNKFDLETEGTLGVSNCKALWFLMCEYWFCSQ